MKKNMGTTDRTIRVLLAIAAAILLATGIITGTNFMIALVIAIIFLLTSLAGFCPLYMLLGINTCKQKK